MDCEFTLGAMNASRRTRGLVALFLGFAAVSLILPNAVSLAQVPFVPQAGGTADGSIVNSSKPDRLKPVLLTDEAGRRVRIPAEVKRVVSLAPNLTEIVFALGRGDQLVGDTDFCDYPPGARKKQHVGGPVNPNFEEIAALNPDVILATSINRRDTVDALDRLGFSVFYTDPHSVDQMISTVEHIGAALHAEESAATLAGDLRARLANLDRGLAGVPPSRVLFVVWTDPLSSIGRGTFIADALRHAGAESVVNTTEEWPHVSLEEVIRLQPEYLVFASAHAADTKPDIDALRSRPGWRELNAVRRGKIVVISDAINRPVPRLVDTIDQLARALHPESFAPGGASSQNAQPLAEEACACAH